MNKAFLIISSLLFSSFLGAQTLYVPANASITTGNGASIISGGEIENRGEIFINSNGSLTSNQNIINPGRITIGNAASFNSVFELENSGTIELRPESDANIMGELINNGTIDLLENGLLNIGGDASNLSVIRNLGTIRLQANWDNQATYEGLNGNMEFASGSDQLIFNESIQFNRLIVNSGGTVTLSGNTAEVKTELAFEDGILTTSPDTRFVVDNSSQVTGGSDFSYFEGSLILEGGPEDPDDNDTETKYFPVGKDGRFNPLTLQEIRHEDFYEIGVELFTPNTTPPTPGEGVIGISENSVWKLDLLTGEVDSAKVFIDFMGENLDEESFTNSNEINADIKRPVVTYADGPDSIWYSLGAAEYFGDSLTLGMILSEQSLFFDVPEKYVAIGLAAKIPDETIIYIPEVFAPGDFREANQEFKIFGENISGDNFKLIIVNRFNNIMYETTNFEEHGWDGTFNGIEQPAGIYYYELTYQDKDGNIEPREGFIYLVR